MSDNVEKGDGKRQVLDNVEREGNQRVYNNVLDAYDRSNAITNKRIEDKLKIDGHEAYIEQELLTRGLAVDIYDKQYDSFQDGLKYIDDAAQTAFDQEFLAYNQKLDELQSQFDNTDRAFRRTTAQSAFATQGVNTNLKNNRSDRAINDLTFASNQLDRQQNRLDYENQQLAISNFDKQRNSLRRDRDIIQNQISNLDIESEVVRNNREILNIRARQRQKDYKVEMTEQSNQMARAAASSRVDLLKSTLATQRATGSAAASGRRGKSAEGVIRTAETLASIDQGAIVDSLERTNESFRNAVYGASTRYKTDRRTTDRERENLNYQLDTIANNRDSAVQNKRKVNNSIDILNNNQEAARNTALQIKKKGKQLKNRGKQIQEQGKKLINQRNQLRNDKAEIATMLGIDKEQFDADTATLNKMMEDQLPAFENVVERISNAVYKDKTNLYNKLPLPPQFAPLADAPYDIPLADLIPRTMVPPMKYDTDSFANPNRFASQGGGNGGLFGAGGAVLGATVGAILAAPTGGMSVLAGAQLGSMIGGGAGSVVDSFSY